MPSVAFRGGGEKRTGFHLDDPQVILNAQVQVEAALRLNDFSRANLPRRARDRAADFHVVAVGRETERLCEETIAHENAERISPARVHSRLGASALRFIDDVVVHERGDVDQLHDHRQIEMKGGNAARRPATQ